MDIDHVAATVNKKQKEIAKTTSDTVMALEKITNVRLSAAQPKNIVTQSSACKFITYKPLRLTSSGPNSRRIKLFDKHVDPLEPPKFKHKKVPVASDSDKVTVLHSPPRAVTAEDQKDWNIPPCISNWKNPKGYSIPLDKRLGVDGRVLEEVRISDKFMIVSEALHGTEKKAKEEIELRAKVDREMRLKEQQRKEEELCALAKAARLERKNMIKDNGGVKEEQRERKRERRLEEKDVMMGKRSKITKDEDRDISENIALGMASTGRRGEVTMYDTRLFNQEKGMDSGFANIDQYNEYDKRFFTSQSALFTLHRPKRGVDLDVYGGAADEQLNMILKRDRFEPDRPFGGTSIKIGPSNNRPVKFEKDFDLYGLNQFLTEIQKGERDMQKTGSSTTMRSGGCSSMQDGYSSGSSSGHSTPVLA